jgi:hypothetical protein
MLKMGLGLMPFTMIEARTAGDIGFVSDASSSRRMSLMGAGGHYVEVWKRRSGATRHQSGPRACWRRFCRKPSSISLRSFYASSSNAPRRAHCASRCACVSLWSVVISKGPHVVRLISHLSVSQAVAYRTQRKELEQGQRSGDETQKCTHLGLRQCITFGKRGGGKEQRHGETDGGDDTD